MERTYRKLEITPDSLLGCRFFDRLERAERAHIARFCEGRCYRAQATIIERDNTTSDVYFILSGAVQTSLYTEEGKMVHFQQLDRGEMFGELAALDGAPRSTDVVAIGDTSVVRVSSENFKDLVARFPSLAELTMLRLCSLARFLCERAAAARVLSIPEQIRLEICRVVRQFPTHDGSTVVDPAPTHVALGHRVGTNREQVTRVMKEFTGPGLIQTQGRVWEVPDVEAVCRCAPTL